MKPCLKTIQSNNADDPSLYFIVIVKLIDFFLHLFVVYVGGWRSRTYHSAHVEVRGQLSGVGFLFLPCGSDYRVWCFYPGSHLAGLSDLRTADENRKVTARWQIQAQSCHLEPARSPHWKSSSSQVWNTAVRAAWLSPPVGLLTSNYWLRPPLTSKTFQLVFY